MTAVHRIPVAASDIVAGRPLPWALYDESGTLLLRQGITPTSQAQAAAIVARNPHRVADGVGEGGGPVASPATQARSSSAVPAALSRKSGEPEPIPVDTLPIMPGDGIRLHPVLDMEASIAGTLIGQLRGKTVVVALPADVKARAPSPAVGDRLTVKFFSGTALFTFSTRVTAAYAQPLPHLHLEYPKTTMVTRIRKSLRASVALPGALTWPGLGKSLPVAIRDLSTGGARLVLEAPLAANAPPLLTLTFKVKLAEDLEEEIQTSVQVRVAEPQKIDGAECHTLGVQFPALSREARLLVTALVYQQQARKSG